jgi:hypothetical protein
MKTDDEIKRDVEAELRWSPQINETDIAIKGGGHKAAAPSARLASNAMILARTRPATQYSGSPP